MANNSSSPDIAHSATTPISRGDRAFGFFDQTALWFSLGVGLLVMQVGAYLTPALGPQRALVAIVGGSLLGAALLAWVAAIGCRRGLSSAGLIELSLGRAFSRLPVGLNVLQLLGWTAFELVVMRDGSAALLRRFDIDGAWVAPVATVLWGALLLALAAGSMVGLVRRFVSRFGLPLVVASLAWLSWQFGERLLGQGFGGWWAKPGEGGMSAVQALDLVIAMPVSWLPLVADYARYGRSTGGTFRGVWLGYTVANLWCYGLGVLVVATAPADADLVSTLLLAQGGLVALGFILIDEVDNAYGDVHSGAVSLHFLSTAKLSIRRAGMTLAAVAVLAALVLPMHSLEPFLLILSSIFVPLFGVVIAQLAGRTTPPSRAVHVAAALVWVAGIVCYQLGPIYWPAWGSALPSFVLTLVLGSLLRMARPAAGAVAG